MKTTFLKNGFPALGFCLAIFGAFAFQTNPESSKVMDHIGALPIPNGCKETSVICTDVNTGTLCTFGGQQLYRKNGTVCSPQLWQQIQP